MSFYKEDNWHAAIIHAPIQEIVSDYGFGNHNVTLLPSINDNFNISEPYGIWHDNKIFIFVKSYNKITMESNIRVLSYSKEFVLLSDSLALEEEWSLSHPYVFKHDGVFYMLPGASDKDSLTLYRAVDFPHQWEKVPAFNFPLSVTNGTLFHYGRRWWLFWAPTDSLRKHTDTLHIAVAEELTGQWADMGAFLTDRGGAVPGGSPFYHSGTLYLPVQQNRRTIGGGIRILRFENFGARPLLVGGRSLGFPASFTSSAADGMRTLSSAGPICLVDVKKETLSLTKPVTIVKNFIERGIKALSEAAQPKSDH